MNRFSSPFMEKDPVKEKKRLKKLREKVEVARRAAFIKGTPEYTDDEYEESKGEKRAQRRYKRLRKRLDKKEQR